MSNKFNEETITYFTELYECNDFAHVSKAVLNFIITDCDTTEDSVQTLFNELIDAVEAEVNAEHPIPPCMS